MQYQIHGVCEEWNHVVFHLHTADGSRNQVLCFLSLPQRVEIKFEQPQEPWLLFLIPQVHDDKLTECLMIYVRPSP